MNLRCTFIPQAWIRDNAVNVDPEGDTQWNMPLSEMEELTGVSSTINLDDDPFARDELRHAVSAPQWVKDWTGPFEIEWELLQQC